MKYLSDALNSAREQKSQPQMAAALSYQGDNAFYRGDMTQAATLYAQALQAASKTGDTQLILRTKVNMAKLSIQQGKVRRCPNDAARFQEKRRIRLG